MILQEVPAESLASFMNDRCIYPIRQIRDIEFGARHCLLKHKFAITVDNLDDPVLDIIVVRQGEYPGNGIGIHRERFGIHAFDWWRLRDCDFLIGSTFSSGGSARIVEENIIHHRNPARGFP